MIFEKLPPDLADLFVRESALAAARGRLEASKADIYEERARLEARTGLLQSLPGRTQEREARLKNVANALSHCDARIKKAASLGLLVGRDIGRWLDCWLKMESPDYAAALAGEGWEQDWTRLGYDFDLLVKSYQMGLHDLVLLHKREQRLGTRSPTPADSVRKLLPTARQIEIDVEFFNRVLTARASQGGAADAETEQHPDYNWCETTQQLAGQPAEAALATLRELLGACTGFLANLNRILKRERELAEERASRAGRAASFLHTQWESLKPAAACAVNPATLDAVIEETEALLTDGEISARFDRHMIGTMTLSPAAPPPAAARSAASDEELRELKARLRAELDEVTRLKAGLAAREQAATAAERKLREAERAFSERCKRELAVIEEARAGLAGLEEAAKLKAREAEEAHAKEGRRLEEIKAELDARASFLEESEQRLMNKGQEQLELLAEIEQKEEELMATRRELNAMRKEMGLPLVALRATPVDEFSE